MLEEHRIKKIGKAPKTKPDYNTEYINNES